MDTPNLFDYDVVDSAGRRIGPVTGLWVDESTSAPEFCSVKTGWIFGREHIVPVRSGHIDHERRQVRVPYEERLIRDAPNYPADERISPGEEDRIYSHYGLERSLSRSPTGLPARGAGTRDAGRDRAEMTLHEEHVNVGKQRVETGQVRLRKVVRSETVNKPVQLRREEIEVERVPASELRRNVGDVHGRAFQEEEVVLREHEERPVIEKSRDVIGGVRAERRVETDTENVRTTKQREDVEIERDEDVDRERRI